MTASSARDAAHREIDALAGRARWRDAARASAHDVVTATAAGTTGPREIAQRYRTVAKSLNRADRARLWQIVRRVANRGLRDFLDRVYRNEL